MKPTLWPFMALLVVMSFSCSTDSIEEDKADELISSYIPETKLEEVEILDLINSYRESQGLNSLTYMSTIKAVAFSHTDYMIRNNEVSHANFFKRKESLEKNAGAKSVSENVAFAFRTPESVVNAWINSDGHRETIEGDFTHFDISMEQDDNGRWFYTNIFIKK